MDMRKEAICLLKRVDWKLAATQCQQVSIPMNQPLEFHPVPRQIGSGALGFSCEKLGVHSSWLRYGQAEAQPTEREHKTENKDPGKTEWLTLACCTSL